MQPATAAQAESSPAVVADATAEEDADDDDFADFSSAPPVAAAAPVEPMPVARAVDADFAFTVKAAPPSRGELALKKLQALVAALPNLSFLAQAQAS